MALFSFRLYLKREVKEGLESEPGNHPPSTTLKKVEVMVEFPVSTSQSGTMERWEGKRAGEYSATYYLKCLQWLSLGAGATGNFFLSASFQF